MNRSAAAILAGLAAACAAAASPARAAPYDEARYHAALAGIGALQEETLAITGALAQGMTQSRAQVLAPHMHERLQWLRATLTAAASTDTATLRHGGQKGAPPYARCIVWRAGDLEDHVQDAATNVALLARGADPAGLIPLDRGRIAAESLRKNCPR